MGGRHKPHYFSSYPQFLSSKEELHSKNIVLDKIKNLDKTYAWLRPNNDDDLIHQFELICAKRRLINHRYCQTPLLPESTIRKAKYILDTLNPKKILLIGDDDLLSIAISLIDSSIQQDVIEIDCELCKFIKKHVLYPSEVRVINRR